MSRIASRIAIIAIAGVFAPATWAQSNDATPEVQQLSQRLRRIESDPELNNAAAYERLQAQQAVQALAVARSKERVFATQIAERRVEAAEIVARSEANRRQIERLDRERSDLLLEASRQDAARARAEAERLRVEAQIQAEEAQRLRAEADAAATAKQQAEDLVIDIGVSEADKLRLAKEREAELARQEAQLKKKTGKPTNPAGKK